MTRLLIQNMLSGKLSQLWMSSTLSSVQGVRCTALVLRLSRIIVLYLYHHNESSSFDSVAPEAVVRVIQVVVVAAGLKFYNRYP